MKLAVAAITVVALALPQGAAAKAIDFRAAFGGGAALGRQTSLRVAVAIDPALPPVTEFRLLTPAGVDLASSGLGVSSCQRPTSDVTDVLGPAPFTPPCPADSLLGIGKADANLLVEPRVGGSAQLRLYSGATVADKPGLIVIADTYNPARYHLTYAGYIYVPPPRFGIGVAIQIPQIPSPPFGALLALSQVSLTIGSASIVYSKQAGGRQQDYHPDGLTLPSRCPVGGFDMRVILRFADQSRRAADATIACPH